VSFNHALRASEAIGLTKEHFADGFLTIQRLKGSLRTTQPLIESAELLLNEKAGVEKCLAGLKTGERLFMMDRHAFAYRMKRYCREAGIPRHKASPHKLKHTMGMTAVKAGIENCRQYLGHKSLASTGAYLRVSDEAACAAVAAVMAGI